MNLTVPHAAEDAFTADFEGAHTYRGRPFRERLPIPHTLLDLLARRARAQEGRPFLTAISAAGEAATLTYGALHLRSRALAEWLRREAGVAPGGVVGLLPLNDVPSIVAVFGVLHAGCAVLLLNPADPPARLGQQTAALGVRVVLRGAGVGEDAYPGALLLPDGAALQGIPPGAPRETAVLPEADAFFFGTSGSTAASKLVAQSHYNAAVNAEGVRRHHALAAGDRLLACLPVHHVNALHLTVFGTLAAGAHVVFAHALDPFGYPALVERVRPRIASVVPSILEVLVETWRGRSVPAGLEYFVSAAAPLSARTARRVLERLGARVMQGYGLTETVNFSTTMPRGLSDAAYRRLMLDRDIPSVGTALYGNEVAVLGPDGVPVPPGTVGEVCVRGHNVMMRYANNREATAEAFRGGWFHTQDLGFQVHDEACEHPFLVLTGRTKNIAKVRGESVSLDEMDRVLRSLPGVVDGAAVAVPDPLLGEAVLVAVVYPGDTREVLAGLRAAFPPAALPRQIVRLDAIPRTPTGKILRMELARTLGAGPQ
ncbi:class I adenylate-forming enzyme family protein [Longimicrobium sp.]|uniref:class I adenylate-forming enzyme family protein n=1 Tax=Longimicrobium sp. TaxID=2029185 RepID=UPI002B7CB874|nr:class I adenylate-forming enzyme family protein [Longimicrobium sp.]HSU16586.1 class I adenylate-forming enzyme family protein [Longimicrobium sp.]